MSLPIDQIILGDCIDVMKGFPDNSIDEIATDPPFGLAFMSKSWDMALPPKAAFVEMCRVLKPGALAFVMSSPRQDLMWRMGQLLEESGFELGQSFISHIYASGFPKAYDLPLGIDSKFIREEFEAENGRQPTRDELKQILLEKRKVIGKGKSGSPKSHNNMKMKNDVDNGGYEFGGEYYITEPASPEAKRWSGWKAVTGLKPALEVIFMVQKPMSEKTIVDNVLKWGTGAMNVDGCRIPFKNEEDQKGTDVGFTTQPLNPKTGWNNNSMKHLEYDSSRGRFPANLIVSDDALNDGKPQNMGHVPKKAMTGKPVTYGKYNNQLNEESYLEDEGSFSRYFDLDAWAEHHGFLCVPKADTGEREYGLYLGEKSTPKSKFNLNNGSKEERFDGGKLNKRRNTHPTVKPVALMAYLIELGCPRGGVVLDPFVGSGTTCVAAKKLNRRYIGIEIDPVSHRLAVSRVAAEPVKLDGVFG